MPGARPPATGAAAVGRIFLPPPLFNPFPFPTFAGQLAATVQGWPSSTFAIPPFGGRFGNGGNFAAWNGGGFGAGFGYPFYGGGDYPPYPPGPYPAAAAGPPPQPANVTVIIPPQQSIPPPPIVMPKEAPAAERSPAPPASERVAPTEFPALIAVRDGAIYTASSYWTKGSTFHFITTQGEHIQIPESRVARLYSAQKDGQPVAPPIVRR